MERIHIVGAGLSGMVAAIDLARQGREVVILEAAPGLGGAKAYHPSMHVTPLDLPFLREFTGLDLTPSFTRLERVHLHIGPDRFVLGPGSLHTVERGGRESAIDTRLYGLAREAGVEFAFSTTVRDFRSLPPGSIIAGGLNGEVYDALGIPCAPVGAYAAREAAPAAAAGPLGLIWFDRYTDLYAYGTVANGLRYILLFSLRFLRPRDLWRFEDHLRETEGLELDRWERITGAVPLADFSNLRLFWEDKILAGSVTGMMDPFVMFGIHGALVSGKVASLAVTDPGRAQIEFRRLTRYFRSTLLFAKVLRELPMRTLLYRWMFRHPKRFGSVLRFGGRGIPGYEHNWAREALADISMPQKQ